MKMAGTEIDFKNRAQFKCSDKNRILSSSQLYEICLYEINIQKLQNSITISIIFNIKFTKSIDKRKLAQKLYTHFPHPANKLINEGGLKNEKFEQTRVNRHNSKVCCRISEDYRI